MGDSVLVREKPDSIEVSRSTKGVYSWCIKVYLDSEKSKKGRQEALSRIDEIDQSLKKKYRY